MNAIRFKRLATVLGCVALLGACSSGNSTSGGITGAVNDAISGAMDKAQEKVQSEPITVSRDVPGQPKAEITPAGDFVVGGKTVAITPAQRTALLAYREQMVAIASQGIAIGKQGAALGMHAASSAIAGVLSGKSGDEIQQKVEAQATDIRKAAAELCDRLPALLAEQQKLAAALPAFKPYATMTQADIDDCRTDAQKDEH